MHFSAKPSRAPRNQHFVASTSAPREVVSSRTQATHAVPRTTYDMRLQQVAVTKQNDPERLRSRRRALGSGSPGLSRGQPSSDRRAPIAESLQGRYGRVDHGFLGLERHTERTWHGLLVCDDADDHEGAECIHRLQDLA